MTALNDNNLQVASISLILPVILPFVQVKIFTGSEDKNSPFQKLCTLYKKPKICKKNLNLHFLLQYVIEIWGKWLVIQDQYFRTPETGSWILEILEKLKITIIYRRQQFFRYYQSIFVQVKLVVVGMCCLYYIEHWAGDKKMAI